MCLPAMESGRRRTALKLSVLRGRVQYFPAISRLDIDISNNTLPNQHTCEHSCSVLNFDSETKKSKDKVK